ncbi:hypothetical protein ABKV19_024890 [Rosa sericea]
MNLIKKSGQDGVAVNRGDGRDGVVSAGQEECVEPAPFGPLPKGYMWAREYICDDDVGPPLYAAPMFCLICSKYFEHMTKDRLICMMRVTAIAVARFFMPLLFLKPTLRF